MGKFVVENAQQANAIRTQLRQQVTPLQLHIGVVPSGKRVKFEFRSTAEAPIVAHERKCDCVEESAIYDEGKAVKGYFDSTAHNYTAELWRDGKRYYKEAQRGGAKILYRVDDGSYEKADYNVDGLEKVKAAELDKQIVLYFAQDQPLMVVDSDGVLTKNPLYIKHTVEIKGFATQTDGS